MKSVEDMTREEKVSACARAAYEANRNFCLTIVDDNIPAPWEEHRPVDWFVTRCY